MNYFVSDEHIEQAVSLQAYRPSHSIGISNSKDFNWEQAKPGISDNYLLDDTKKLIKKKVLPLYNKFKEYI